MLTRSGHVSTVSGMAAAWLLMALVMLPTVLNINTSNKAKILSILMQILCNISAKLLSYVTLTVTNTKSISLVLAPAWNVLLFRAPSLVQLRVCS